MNSTGRYVIITILMLLVVSNRKDVFGKLMRKQFTFTRVSVNYAEALVECGNASHIIDTRLEESYESFKNIIIPYYTHNISHKSDQVWTSVTRADETADEWFWHDGELYPYGKIQKFTFDDKYTCSGLKYSLGTKTWNYRALNCPDQTAFTLCETQTTYSCYYRMLTGILAEPLSATRTLFTSVSTLHWCFNTCEEWKQGNSSECWMISYNPSASECYIIEYDVMPNDDQTCSWFTYSPGWDTYKRICYNLNVYDVAGTLLLYPACVLPTSQDKEDTTTTAMDTTTTTIGATTQDDAIPTPKDTFKTPISTTTMTKDSTKPMDTTTSTETTTATVTTTIMSKTITLIDTTTTGESASTEQRTTIPIDTITTVTDTTIKTTRPTTTSLVDEEITDTDLNTTLVETTMVHIDTTAPRQSGSNDATRLYAPIQENTNKPVRIPETSVETGTRFDITTILHESKTTPLETTISNTVPTSPALDAKATPIDTEPPTTYTIKAVNGIMTPKVQSTTAHTSGTTSIPKWKYTSAPINSTCKLTCHCGPKLYINTSIAEILANLRINVKNTSSYKRLFSSAIDDRPLSIGIGWSGAGVLIFVGAGILALDCHRLFQDAMLLYSNVRHLFQSSV